MRNVCLGFYQKRPDSRPFYYRRLPLNADFTPLYPFSVATFSAFAVNFLRNMHSRDLSIEYPSRILSLLFNDPVAGSLNNFANLNRAQFSLVAKLYMPYDPRVSCNLAFPVIRSRISDRLHGREG